MFGEAVTPPPVWRRIRLAAGLVALVTLVLDQWSKHWMLTGILPCLSGPTGPGCAVNTPWIEVTGFFNLVMVWNHGVSFGMFASVHDIMPYVLIAVALAISILLLFWLRRTDRMINALAIGLVVGGAIGNVIDRIRFGAVADFLDFHVAGWHWPAFNVADCGVVVGVCLLLIDGLFSDLKRR